MPGAPESLKAAGMVRWSEDGALLVALGVITALDLPAFELYCRAWDEVAACEAAIEELPYIVSDSGYLSPHPATAQRKAALERIKHYQQVFGMTPSSRSSVSKANKPTSGGVPSRKRA